MSLVEMMPSIHALPRGEKFQLVQELIADLAIDRGLPEANRRARMLAALDAVAEMGSEEEQRDTFTYLARAFDEDRTSDRKLFI